MVEVVGEAVDVDAPQVEHVAEAMHHRREVMDIRLDTHLHPPLTMAEDPHPKHTAATSPNSMQIGIFAGRVDMTWKTATPAPLVYMNTGMRIIRKEQLAERIQSCQSSCDN